MMYMRGESPVNTVRRNGMSTGFNWFKSYKITIHKGCEIFDYDDVSLKYINGGSTSHSGANIGKVQDLIEKYGGKRIPSVCKDWIDSEDYDLKLIDPSEMSEICKKILAESDVDKVDMRDRIEWFKELSDHGFYLTYDYE